MDNYFIKLNNLDVSDKIEKKNGLSYVSWAYAWGEIKKIYPDTTYTIYESEITGMPYFTDGRTCMVKTGVTCNGIEHIEYLPIMDFKNKSIPLENVTSMDINKAIQRSLTKAIGRHGVGLFVYAGEDLPEEALKKANEELEKEVSAKSVDRIANKKKVFADMCGKTVEEVDKALSDKGVTTNKDIEKTLDSWLKAKGGGAIAYR